MTSVNRPIIGSVPYLNAKPLCAWFHTEEGEKTVSAIHYSAPSQLAMDLKNRKIAAGMVSSFESFRRSDAVIAPGISISSDNQVQSVRLFSKMPFERIQSVALDESSLTAANLTRILFAEYIQTKPRFNILQPDLSVMLTQCDAGLLIGDPGMGANADGLHVLDLGTAWNELTGLPFVWAVWLVNEEQFTPELANALLKAKEWGLNRLPEIARSESVRLGWNVETCLSYLRDIINFDLTPERHSGLEKYKYFCQKHQLIMDVEAISVAE